MASLQKTFLDLEKVKCEPDDKRKKVGNYLLSKTLGHGSFGKVRIGTHVLAKEKYNKASIAMAKIIVEEYKLLQSKLARPLTHRPVIAYKKNKSLKDILVAIKVITKKAILMRDYLKKNLRREALVLQRLSHPNIIRLYEVMETENCYYMVMELALGGDFVKYLSVRKRLDELETRKFMRQLVSAVDHIHRSGIIHRDLKLENLLLDEHMNIKLIDFGLSNFLQAGQLLSTQCGSPAFTAPEILSQKKYGASVDIWTMGVDMYTMLTGRIPFESAPPSNLIKLYASMLRGCHIPETLSAGCQDLIGRMLEPRESTRITLGGILSHSWITEGMSNPVTRIEIKSTDRPRAISDEVVQFLLHYVNMPENELRIALHSPKANSLAAMHDLIKERLQRGLEFPKRLLGSSRLENEETREVTPSDSGSTKMDEEDGNRCTKCLQTIHVGNLHESEKNFCSNCGLKSESREVLLEILKCQKLFPVLQDLPYVTEGEKAKTLLSSECSDIVSMLNNVDEEAFERALKLIRGYRNLPDPPTPPNSAFGCKSESPPPIIAERLAKLNSEPDIVERYNYLPQNFPIQRLVQVYEPLNSRQKKPGQASILTVLPPIEIPTGRLSPVLSPQEVPLPNAVKLGTRFSQKKTKSIFPYTDKNLWASSRISQDEQARRTKSRKQPLPVVQFGSKSDIRLRHSLDAGSNQRPKKNFVHKTPSDIYYESRKTAR